MGTQDKVTLSPWERQQLARMQAVLAASDPLLAKTLGRAGQPKRERPPAWRTSHRRVVAELARAWMGPAAVLAGLAVVFLGLALALWLSVVGALVTTVGLWLCGVLLERRHGRQKRKAQAPTGTAS